MLSRTVESSSTWHFVSITFYFCLPFCACISSVVFVESRQNDGSNDVDDEDDCNNTNNDGETKQTEHFYIARRHLLNVCSDFYSIIIIIII